MGDLRPPEENDPLSRLEEQLDEIEASEIVEGVTSGDLEEKGFIGDGPVKISHPAFKEVTPKEKLCFEAGVEFARIGDKSNFSEISIESHLQQKDVEKGGLIASRSAEEKTAFDAGDNVRKEVKDKREYYFAACTGKALIIGEKLYVLPSDVDSRIRLVVSLDRLKAFVDCLPARGKGAPLTSEGVYALLAKNSITQGIRRESIEKAVKAANETGLCQKDVLAAEGSPPQKGEDGRVEYGFDLKAQKQEFKILPDGRIDYRSSISILLTKKGQILARLIPPGPGREGTDVFGKALKNEPGRPASLIAGKGVDFSKEMGVFTSAMDGHIVLNGAVLEVMQLYLVNGDVDFSTGNIHFSGNVVITGTVQEGFEVRAEGDITVLKGVEPCRLIAGRDIVIKGGIQGRGKGLVSAGRDIVAEYAQNARLEAQGNIIIRNFLVNSCAFTSKALTVTEKKGLILGGEIYAQKEVSARIIGSHSGTKTYVEAGTDFVVRRKLTEIERAAAFCRENITKIDAALKPVAEMARLRPDLLGPRAEIVKKTLEKKKQLEAQEKIMAAKMEELRAGVSEQGQAFVKVLDTCYPDVYVKIKAHGTTLSAPRSRVQFRSDSETGEVVTGPL